MTRGSGRMVTVGTVTVAAPPLFARRLSRAQLLAGDVLLAAGAGLLAWYAAGESPIPPAGGWREPGWVTVLTGVLLGAPVAVRRLHPVAAAVVATVAASLAVATAVIPGYAGAAPTTVLGLVLYAVGGSVPLRPSIAVAAGCTVTFMAALAYTPISSPGPGALFGGLVLGASWAVGWTLRERRAYAARLAERDTARAVGDERLRIAREMHDVVAHSMSLIAVKATIANHVADQRPQEVRDALRVIEATSRGALADLRRTLGALRTEADFAPAPGVTDLPALVATTTAAGVAVELTVTGEEHLPEGAGLTVFRIVQEALTNVVKHAGATHCRVRVAGEPGRVTIEVVDDELIGGVYRLEGESGKLAVAADKGEPAARLTVAGISGLAYGVLDPIDVVARGFGEVAAEAVEPLRALFPRELPYMFADF